MIETSKYDPTGVLIDGALPRTPATRVNDLLAEAETILNQYRNTLGRDNYENVRLWSKWYELELERGKFDDEWEHWHELEDDVLELINDALPAEYTCALHQDDPGTVCIWRTDEDDTN